MGPSRTIWIFIAESHGGEYSGGAEDDAGSSGQRLFVHLLLITHAVEEFFVEFPTIRCPDANLLDSQAFVMVERILDVLWSDHQGILSAQFMIDITTTHSMLRY